MWPCPYKKGNVHTEWERMWIGVMLPQVKEREGCYEHAEPGKSPEQVIPQRLHGANPADFLTVDLHPPATWEKRFLWLMTPAHGSPGTR